MKLKPYPKYKDSGIQWIGEIPEEWEFNKIKNTSYVKGRIGWHGLTSEEYSDEGAYLVTGTDFKEGVINWNTCHHVGWDRYREDPYIHLRDNDLLITKDGTIGKVALANNLHGKATLNTGVFLIRPLNKKYNTRFMYWVLNSAVFERFFDYMKKGATVSHLYQETFEMFFFPIPTKIEQVQIAEYLDKKSLQIDKTIQKDKQLIELLKEKRKALINNAVTKGLDPNSKIKNVNLLTCNETPENWEIIRIKFVSKLSRGFDLSNDDFEEGNIPVYGSNGIIGYHNKSTSKGPAVTVGRSGSVGEVNFVNDKKYWAHNTSLYLQESHGNDVKYIFYLLSTLDLKHLAAGSAVGTLNRNYVHDVSIPLPPKSEQYQIVQYLDKQTSKVDKTIQKIERKIKLLEEYKKSLIHYVITGKIDVRSVAP